jgi:pyruvate/2-oxoglutarate dehydrogenase complex dihydrolipoamide dehydrogenase (E3) component
VKDGVKCVTEKEVHHFGIPTARTVEQKRRTKIQPFSFEERDRQRLKKKEETIQKVSHASSEHTVDSEVHEVINLIASIVPLKAFGVLFLWISRTLST